MVTAVLHLYPTLQALPLVARFKVPAHNASSRYECARVAYHHGASTSASSDELALAHQRGFVVKVLVETPLMVPMDPAATTRHHCGTCP